MEKPDNLGSAGTAFWDEVTDPDARIEMRTDEYRILAMACETLDLIGVLDEEFTKDPSYVVKGSTGQPVINPLIAQKDKAMGRYQALVRQLQLPDSEDRAKQRAEQMSGDMAALGRVSWAVRKRG